MAEKKLEGVKTDGQTKGSGGRQINRLNARQQFQLAAAILEHRERLCRECPTLDAAAEEFGKLLGFKVGPSSVRTAMEAAGVAWDTSRRRRNNEPNWILLGVSPPPPWRPGAVSPDLSLDAERRPKEDDRLCRVMVRRDLPPAASAAWLRRLADLLERCGTEVRTYSDGEPDDPAEQEKAKENDGRIRDTWAEIVAAEEHEAVG